MQNPASHDFHAAHDDLVRNMVVFVAPDKPQLDELRDAARSFLAWDSVVADHEELNLDAQQRRHADTYRCHLTKA